MKIGKVTRFDDPRPFEFRALRRNPDDSAPRLIIHRRSLEQMYEHAAGEMQHEVGGYLLGVPIIDPSTQSLATYIDYALPATYDSTPSHVTMHPSSLVGVETLREKTGTLLVGYYHSHPRISIFQSGEDVHNFRLYYPQSYQVAIVVDPSLTPRDRICKEGTWIGFFVWDQNQNPVRMTAKQVIIVPETLAIPGILPAETAPEEPPAEKQAAPVEIHESQQPVVPAFIADEIPVDQQVFLPESAAVDGEVVSAQEAGPERFSSQQQPPEIPGETEISPEPGAEPGEMETGRKRGRGSKRKRKLHWRDVLYAFFHILILVLFFFLGRMSIQWF